MKTNIFLTTSASICISFAHAQQKPVNQIKDNTIRKCATEQVYEEYKKSHPDYYYKSVIKEQNYKQKSGKTAGTIITIPVVVHVIYRTADQNISDAQIQSQIDVLNADYRRKNTDSLNTPSVFQNVAADTEIEFCLATQDTNGNATTGITRTATSVAGIGYANNRTLYYHTSKGGKDIWNRDRYLNIWVCEIETDGSIKGFSHYPGFPADEDGVIIDYRCFGTIGTATSPTDKGRTVTHEVGHWLNLKHIWGQGAGGCSNDDDVTDTPEQDQSYFGCPTFPQSSCGSYDMFMNYMDYSDDVCMNLFTQGQKDRMIYAVNAYRKDLLTSLGCQPPGTIDADFIANINTITMGESVTFTDQSRGKPTSWLWSFAGGTPSTSTSQNPVITYNTQGCYDVTLTATNSSDSDVETKTKYICVISGGGECDTLNYPLNGTPTLIKAGVGGSGGYISGNNYAGDLSLANYFNSYSPYEYITGALIQFGFVKNISNGSVTVSVWDNSGKNGYPGDIIISKDISISSISADIKDSAITEVAFDVVVNIPDNFYLGVVLPDASSGDAIAVITNSPGDVKSATAWSEGVDGNWYPFDAPQSWNLKVALAIHPIVCMTPTSSIATHHADNYIKLYPSPTADIFTLETNNTGLEITDIKIQVLNILGQCIKEIHLLSVNGKIKQEINLSDQPNGLYTVYFQSKKGIVVNKINVIKNM